MSKTNTTTATKTNKGKGKGKDMPKRSPGRPTVYNRDKILEELRKYQGQQGGMRAAYKGLRALKAFNCPEKGLNLSYQTVVNIARQEGIQFKMGRPTEPPTAKGTKPKGNGKGSKGKANKGKEAAPAKDEALAA